MRTFWHAAWWAACIALAACGGGDGRGEDAIATPEPSSRCEGCQRGRLTGTVSIGLPLAGAQVVVRDAAGGQAAGATDDAGRYDIDVSALEGTLVVQALGSAGGQAQLLHGTALRSEVGVAVVNVTPLTEMVLAQALGGHPADLLQAGRAEFLRIDGGLPEAHRRVAQAVGGVLEAAGVPAGADLRTSPMERLPALARALALLDVARAEGGHAVRHLAMAPGDALALRFAGAGEPATLPPPGPGLFTVLDAARSALPGLQQRLDALAALYATGVPPASALEDFVAPSLHHAGLDAQGFLAQVLRRQDAVARGGFSLQGVRFDELRLRGVGDGGQRLYVSWRVVPRPPHAPYDETMWFSQADGRWRMLGDGLAARVRVRNAALLGPRARSEGAVRSLAGVACHEAAGGVAGAARERCSIEGGLGDVPAGGWLDLGEVGDPRFGVRTLYWSDAASPLQRLADHRQRSRLLGEPSAQVVNHLLFELDALQVDPRAVRAVVTGPGLPATGLALYPPKHEAASLPFAHWTLDPEGLQDWHAVRLPDAGPPGSGAPYRFLLLDAAGAAVQAVEASLPSAPLDEASLFAQRDRLFAQWDLAAQPLAQPTLARLLASDSAEGDALAVSQPWRAPAGHGVRSLHVDLEWHRAALPPDAAPRQTLRQRWAVDGGDRLLQAALPAREGHRTVWLNVVLSAGDALGNRYLHHVSPDNPH
ncbi:hypothetical protein V4F39_02435 [Aquincola sp. MAHUQ-54]|uniref:Carboxypeptidase regulatory-like domain-containing protein n=2 Tax=Sphaerotilaceae TaxID=2975441 RepID=A0AAW9Q1C0_9BURK